MPSREFASDIDQVVLAHPELGQLARRLDFGLGEVPALRFRDVLHLGLARADLQRGVTVLLLVADGDHVAAIHL